MAGTLLDAPWFTGFLDSGAIAPSSRLFFYLAGTSTKTDTYSDAALTTPNTNPVVLDSAGRARIFLVPAVSYKVVMAPPGSDDPPSSPIFTQDNVVGYATSDVAANANTDLTGTAGEDISARDAVFLSDGSSGTTAGRWYRAVSTADYSSTGARVRGVAVSSVLTGNVGTFRIMGKVSGYTSLTAGLTYHVGTTPGGLAAPGSITERAVPVGFAESSTVLVLNQWSGDIFAEQFGEQINAQNLITNGDFRQWNEPSSGGPYLWTFAGAGGTIVRTGTGEADTFSFNAGRYAAKMTRAGTDLTLTQTVLDTTRMPYMSRGFGSKRCSFFVLGKTSTANHLRIQINDGATITSSYHTGSGSTEVIQVTRQLQSSPTQLTVQIQVNNTNAAAYVGGAVLVISDIAPQDWLAGPDRYEPARVMYSSVTDIGNVGGGTDDLHSVTLSPDTIRGVGDVLHVSASFTTANNANAKTVTFVWNGGTIITANLVASVATTATADVWIVSTGLNTQFVWGWIAHSGAGGATPIHASGQATGAATETGTIILKFTGAGTANDDIVQKNILVERLSGGRNLG